MATLVPSRELRNNTRGLLGKVEAGEEVVITVDGRPVAAMHPVSTRPRWISRSEFTEWFLTAQADPELRRDLDELAGDTTDDLPEL